MVQRILRVLKDTPFKLRPEQGANLAPEEKFQARAGATYPIQSYAYADVNGSFNGNIKFSLAGQAIQGFNTWFVYSGDAQVEFDGVVVYPHEDQEVLPILQINRDTAFKRRPLDTSVLPPGEVRPVEQGRVFPLHSYAYADSQGDFSSHIKVAFRYQQDFIDGISTWFVYDGHAYVEMDGEVVYPANDPDMPVLRVTANTIFKRRPVNSTELSATERFDVTKGSLWELDSYAFADASGPFNGHIKIALKYSKDYIRGFSTWYVYDRHARVEIQGKVVYPRPTPSPSPTPTPPTYSGIAFRLPGQSSTFYTDQPIIPGGSFTWGEATKNGSRIPNRAEYVDNIVALARQLQRARNQIGRSFQVNSWYRPPDVNASVGGASRSQHLYGSAADLQVDGYSGRRVANAVLSWWNGGIGIYSNLPNVVHLDVGPRRYWGF